MSDMIRMIKRRPVGMKQQGDVDHPEDGKKWSAIAL